MPANHELYAQLQAWVAAPAEYRGALQPPQPVAWSKQVGFFGADAGEITGIFFQNSCKSLPVQSDWRREVREGMDMLISH